MEQPPSVSQLVVAGVLGDSPSHCGRLLLAVAVLLGAAVTLLIVVWVEQAHTATELRLIQQQLIDTNAILLRRGYIQPGDLDAPAKGRSPQ